MEVDNSLLQDLAGNIIKVSRNHLIVNLRFMDTALVRLKGDFYEGTIATDGEYLHYNPMHILKCYKSSKNLVTHAYLHMIMHCVFQHFYVDIGEINHDLWNIACDAACEAVIADLKVEPVKLAGDVERQLALDSLKERCKYLTAECIYTYLIDECDSEDEIRKYKVLFEFDDHSLWYELGGLALEDNGNNNYEVDHGMEKRGKRITASLSDIISEWQKVSESIKTNMETFMKNRGDECGNLMQNLESVTRESYDYTDFLKRFSVLGETMKINDDEFDYIFYTYGMDYYENRMPLIEPLEYKDVKKIKEFVIAIDTSGSTSGDLVREFLNKTYNILKQEENFFTKINLHIIQCDCEIQEDHKITSQEEFDEYISNLKVLGHGGTDFRPVFSYVDKLIEAGEFTNLKGLIYFTDGYGVFPKKQPEYSTAFVYLDDGYNNYDVPVWAIKLILRSSDIKSGRGET